MSENVSDTQPKTGATGAKAPSKSNSAGDADERSIDTPEEIDGTEEEQAELSLDIIFEMLRNRRRQLVLEYLRERDETVTIGDLAEHIAAIENDTTVRQLNAQQRKRVYIGLYQCHLPKMDDVDVIEFNQSRGRIAPGKHIEPLYEYLDVANGKTDSKADAKADAEQSPFDRQFLLAAVGLSAVFFAAQFTGAYMIASAAVASLLIATVAKSY